MTFSYVRYIYDAEMAFLTYTNRAIYLTKQQNICRGNSQHETAKRFQRLDY